MTINEKRRFNAARIRDEYAAAIEGLRKNLAASNGLVGNPRHAVLGSARRVLEKMRKRYFALPEWEQSYEAWREIDADKLLKDFIEEVCR